MEMQTDHPIMIIEHNNQKNVVDLEDSHNPLEYNLIYVNPHVQKKQENTENIRKSCKSCLQQEGHFISPCQCSGSMKFIHYQCLQQWMLNILKQKSYTEFKNATCEVCHTKYNFQCVRDRYCSIDILFDNYSKYKVSYRQFLVSVGILFLSFLAFTIILGLINSNSSTGIKIKQFLQLGDNTTIVLAGFIFVLICVILMILIIFLAEYALHSEVKITKISNYSRTGKRRI